MYVGLPLAVEFGKLYNTVGFDIHQGTIDELRRVEDSTLEVESEDLKKSSRLSYRVNLADYSYRPKTSISVGVENFIK